MTKKEINSQASKITKLQNKGERREGYYIRSRQGNFGTLYDFIDKAGNQFTMAHQTDLDTKMIQIPLGTWTEIELIDFKQTKAGNEMKIFLVNIVPEDNFNMRKKDHIPPDLNPSDEVPF